MVLGLKPLTVVSIKVGT